MRGAFVIAGKDLRNIFLSPLFYILAGLCSLAWTFLFLFSLNEFLTQTNFAMGAGRGEETMSIHFSVFARHISLVNLVMIFAVAALTMRLFTDEKRNRTYDLLLTAPVTATEITLGKLIAGVATAWALLAVSLLYPLSLAPFVKIEWGPLAASYIGLMLITASYVAIGMFASSLTESAVLAVIMALIFNVMLWFVGAAADSASNPVTQAIFEHLNVGAHFVNFVKGSISIASVTFFASVIFLASFLTQRVVESSRWR